jgi:hypothetical protein
MVPIGAVHAGLAALQVEDRKMSSAPEPTTVVTSFEMETTGDYIHVFVSLSDDSPADTTTEVRVILYRHDDIAVHWWAKIPCHYQTGRWVGELNSSHAPMHPLAQLAKVVIGSERQTRPCHQQRFISNQL